MKNFKKKI